ncbi:class I SAM-dependent methyltransferase [Paenibacillus sp. 481]|uniref:class I SAM-dependent methyltransferase n=1 Tax=Paenibacillus sp. 481 TaxID=2835869 RepID=UPI001E50E06C|nr:SAM-dependent methyltransferase [Paenibacillus sp. 481]UHA74756.1 SAM-dependent methyltransferase [Paenibacillus sp. 481]
MEQLAQLINRVIEQSLLDSAVLSQLRKKTEEGYTKLIVKPVLVRDELHLQFEYHFANKVTHENVPWAQASERLLELFETTFRQGLLRTTEADYQVLISKKFKVSIRQQAAVVKKVDVSHNRKKQYVLNEGDPVPFLIELGIMNEQGKVLAAKYDKFKQINRFLEMVADVLPYLPQGRTVRILDFGCGKSYLTFALYHFLKVQSGKDVHIIGLDLKKDVIEHCESLARRLQYDGLSFLVGDIAEYGGVDTVDMVVTLHACDIATDAALNKAVRWGASVILSVPCCQHELYRQVEQEVLGPILEHGILRERFASLSTDAVRAKLLDCVGYRTQLLEFIDMEHTPKNLLIRAVRTEGNVEQSWQQYTAFRDFLSIQPYLERALADLLPGDSAPKR